MSVARGLRTRGIEKALDNLEKKAKALLELHQEQSRVGVDTGRWRRHVSPYDYVLKDRILARLGGVLVGVPGAGSWRRTPLTEDEWFTKTIAEEERAKEIQEKAKRLQEEEREDPGVEIGDEARAGREG